MTAARDRRTERQKVAKLLSSNAARDDMLLQLIPGFSKTVKTTSKSRVPSNELVGLCQSENIQANGELTENVDIRYE